METRVCALCQEEKSIDSFAWKNKETGARQHRCNPCRSTYPGGVRPVKTYTCMDCGAVKGRKGVRCLPCSGLHRRMTTRKKRQTTEKGYIVIRGMQGHPNARGNGEIFEHTVVMSEMIDRALLPDEQVHHKNGQRDDNRPENLELWSVSQPYGQRVEDKIEWAIDYLFLHGYDVTQR